MAMLRIYHGTSLPFAYGMIFTCYFIENVQKHALVHSGSFLLIKKWSKQCYHSLAWKNKCHMFQFERTLESICNKTEALGCWKHVCNPPDIDRSRRMENSSRKFPWFSSYADICLCLLEWDRETIISLLIFHIPKVWFSCLISLCLSVGLFLRYVLWLFSFSLRFPVLLLGWRCPRLFIFPLMSLGPVGNSRYLLFKSCTKQQFH